MIDFDDIKARHRIEDFLARRGIEVKRAAGGFTCKCPFHDGDNKASLFIHGAKQYAKCWTRCGYIGSVLDVVMALDGAENAIAAAEILEGRPLTEEEKSRPKVQRTVHLRFEDTMTRRTGAPKWRPPQSGAQATSTPPTKRHRGTTPQATPPTWPKQSPAYDLDPCTPPVMPWTTAARRYTKADNGLVQPWEGRVWCNPPYGKETGRWLARCAEHENATALIFARTETADWHAHIWHRAHSVFFFEGRLHFRRPDGSRPKINAGGPSALIAYNAANTEAIKRAMIAAGLRGKLILL